MGRKDRKRRSDGPKHDAVATTADGIEIRPIADAPPAAEPSVDDHESVADAAIAAILAEPADHRPITEVLAATDDVDLTVPEPLAPAVMTDLVDDLAGAQITEPDEPIDAAEVLASAEAPAPEPEPALEAPAPEPAPEPEPEPAPDPEPALEAPEPEPALEPLVRARLAPWQSAALATTRSMDDDEWPEVDMSRFERRNKPHLSTPKPPKPAQPIDHAPPPPPAPMSITDAEPPDSTADTTADSTAPVAEPVFEPLPIALVIPAPVIDLDATEDEDPATSTGIDPDGDALDTGHIDLTRDHDGVELSIDSMEDLQSAVGTLMQLPARERGKAAAAILDALPERITLVSSTGDTANPGELVNFQKLPQVERTRLIIRVLCGLVAEIPDEPAATADLAG